MISPLLSPRFRSSLEVRKGHIFKGAWPHLSVRTPNGFGNPLGTPARVWKHVHGKCAHPIITLTGCSGSCIRPIDFTWSLQHPRSLERAAVILANHFNTAFNSCSIWASKHSLMVRMRLLKVPISKQTKSLLHNMSNNAPSFTLRENYFASIGGHWKSRLLVSISACISDWGCLGANFQSSHYFLVSPFLFSLICLGALICGWLRIDVGS